MKKNQNNGLTFDELMVYAREHYNEGGDGVYECWDKYTYDEYVRQFGPITKKVALDMFEDMFEIDNEYRKAAEYFGRY